jgi:hypothetical protein
MATSSLDLPLTRQEAAISMKQALMAMILVAGITTAAEVDKRQHNQQKRIAQGVRSGSLTPAETARLEKREAKVRRDIHRDRVDGGGMTAAEKAKINREQNRNSRAITRAKTN